eukprot:UN31467
MVDVDGEGSQSYITSQHFFTVLPRIYDPFLSDVTLGGFTLTYTVQFPVDIGKVYWWVVETTGKFYSASEVIDNTEGLCRQEVYQSEDGAPSCGKVSQGQATSTCVLKGGVTYYLW